MRPLLSSWKSIGNFPDTIQAGTGTAHVVAASSPCQRQLIADVQGLMKAEGIMLEEVYSFGGRGIGSNSVASSATRGER
jgi:hypothetical protein